MYYIIYNCYTKIPPQYRELSGAYVEYCLCFVVKLNIDIYIYINTYN